MNSSEAGREDAQRTTELGDFIFDRIAHGDEKHQEWLRDKSYQVACQWLAALRAQPTHEPQQGQEPAIGNRLWLWKNFVDGNPEYWAFDNAYPCYANGDPMTLGSPCGYALVRPSTNGRPEVTDDEVLAEIKRAIKDHSK